MRGRSLNNVDEINRNPFNKAADSNAFHKAFHWRVFNAKKRLSVCEYSNLEAANWLVDVFLLGNPQAEQTELLSIYQVA